MKDELNLMVDLINRKKPYKAHTKPIKPKEYNRMSNYVYAFISGIIVAELIILLMLHMEGIC